MIPGSKNVDHIKDNLDILDFKLTENEMSEIAKLDKDERYYHRTDEQLVLRNICELSMPSEQNAHIQNYRKFVKNDP